MQFVYVVEMLRYGNREGHSYVLGVYSDKMIAEYEAQLHVLFRANKYYAEIREEQIDGHGGKGLVSYIEECLYDEEDLENDIKSRKDYLKYREKQLKTFKLSE